MARHGKRIEPLETDVLIDRAYSAVAEQELQESGSDIAERCPDNLRALLRMVDYISRQRTLEHTEREIHRPQGTRRAPAAGKARAFGPKLGRAKP